ncbi:MAG: hypothetical protein ACFNZ2_01290, partial [Prevotella histicola]
MIVPTYHSVIGSSSFRGIIELTTPFSIVTTPCSVRPSGARTTLAAILLIVMDGLEYPSHAWHPMVFSLVEQR